MEDSRHDEAGHIRNYAGQEALDKLKEMAESARICMFTTFTPNRPLSSRPMALQQVDADGSMYFFSVDSSDQNEEIQADPAVQLFFMNTGSSEYLSIYGKAAISNDRAKIRELWTDYAKIWFQDGPEDPTLTLVRVHPQSCQYWDTKHNKMVQLLKMAASLVTGKVLDDSVEGKLQV